ncbi:MAG: methyl-accepting chemotaxis protein [Dehalococcoidia bacterium]|nr:methyl-accepting chemotaxis protein [Dehalococcoidia bacterium]
MTWFNNLRLQFKLLAGFTLVLVLLAVVAVVGVLQLQKASDRTESMYSHNLLAGQNVLEANRYFIAFARDFRGAVLATDPARRTTLLDLARTDLQHGSDYWAAYIEGATGAAAAEQLAKLEPLVKETTATRTAALDMAATGDIEGGWEMESGHFEKVLEQNQLLQEAGELQATNAAAARDSAADNAASSRTLLIALTVSATVIGFAFAFWLARSLSGAAGTVVRHLKSLQEEDLRHLQGAMSAMAAGDLTVTVKPAAERIARFNKDEVGQAAASVNAIIDTVGETVAEYNRSREALAALIESVQHNADSILSVSDQIRDSSDQMAAATGQIATAINEVTRSAVSLSGLSQDSAREIERVASGSQQVAAGAATSADSAAQSRQEAFEMGERIQVVATASKEVAQAADESRSAAQQGQQAVGQAVTSMESIATAVQRASRTVDQLGEYGQQIGDIVKAIDEIAAQTNLLALNAAIEAARAGEQGRGFAVVAENVRSLAERSSESTKEIADLIAKVQQGTQEAVEAMAVGVRDVQDGQRITEEAGQSLTSIIGTVELSATRMQEIARDVQGLASGAERIISSAEGIAELARESAAGAGEMAAGTTRVTEAIIQVSATSEETSASAEEVSASTEELSAQSEELAATANQMREMAEALQKASARFKLA